jgi:predicted ABC-type ATPase
MGGHDVPEVVIRRRYRRGVQNFFGLYRALAKTWGVYDNSASGDPVLMATGIRDISVVIHEPEEWRRFCEGQNGSNTQDS